MVRSNNIVAFHYMGKTCSGYVMSSTDLEPHYHWFFFNEREYIERIGESIPFIVKDGELVPANHYSEHEGLVTVIKTVLEKLLFPEKNPAGS
ncbi:MAG TPA: hypothetical protein VF145_10260 [Chitinophagaceae bacterium]